MNNPIVAEAQRHLPFAVTPFPNPDGRFTWTCGCGFVGDAASLHDASTAYVFHSRAAVSLITTDSVDGVYSSSDMRYLLGFAWSTIVALALTLQKSIERCRWKPETGPCSCLDCTNDRTILAAYDAIADRGGLAPN